MTSYPHSIGTCAIGHNCAAVQYSHHADPVDADDFDQSDNPGSPGDVSIFRGQYHRGFTSEAQKRFDPKLFQIVELGALQIIVYDGEVTGVNINGPGDAPKPVIDDWFADLLVAYMGKVSL